MIQIVLVSIKSTSFLIDEGSNQSSESCSEFSDSDTDSEAATDSASDTEAAAQTSDKVHLLTYFKGKQKQKPLWCKNKRFERITLLSVNAAAA